MQNVRSFNWRIMVVVAAMGMFLMPRSARADGFVTPFIGVNFAGVTGTTLVNAAQDNSRLTYGVSLGFMTKGIIGFEEDIAYAPRFIAGNTVFGQTNVFTAMSNVIIGIPIGGELGGGIRPYAVGGVGLMRTHVDSAVGAFTSLDRNSFGFDLGAGVNGYFSDNIGLRGEIRYFRDFRVTDADNPIGIVLNKGNLDFFRGTVGLVLRF